MRFSTKRLLVLFVICFCPITLLATADWQVLKTEHFEVIYKPAYKDKAKEALKVLENYRENVIKLTGHDIGKLKVVIEDIGSDSNGFTDPINPNIHLYTYPPDSFSNLGYGENWWRMVGVHEAIHMAQLTKTGGFPKVLTTLFGNAFSPNLIIPQWMAEGIAVYGESQLSPYEGRLNDGFFDAVMLALTAEGQFPSLKDITYDPFTFPSLVGGAYLYGGEFLNYLKEKYGEKSFSDFFRYQGKSFLAWFPGAFLPFLGIDSSSRKAYGKSFNELWAEWHDYWLSKASAWKVDGKQITSNKLSLAHNLTINKNLLYYVKEEARKTSALPGGGIDAWFFTKIIQRDLKTHEEKEIFSTNSSRISTPLRVFNNYLYYTLMDIKRGYANSSANGFGSISNMHRISLATGQDEILFSDELRAFCILGDGRIIYAKDRTDGFGSEIIVYPADSTATRLKSDYLIDQMITDNDSLVIVARKDWDNWGIYSLDIKNNAVEAFPLINTPFAEVYPSLVNGRLIFVANYDKVYRIYAYDVANRKLCQLTDGSFAHFPALNPETNELYFVGLNSTGMNIYKKSVDFTNEFTLHEIPESMKPDLSATESKMEFTDGNYCDILKTLFPAVRVPTGKRSGYLQGYDVTGEHNYVLSGRFGKDAITSFTYYTNFFAPFTAGLAVYNEEDVEKDISLFSDYPVYVSAESGLSLLSAFFLFDMDKEEGNENYSKKFKPGITTTLSYPKFSVSNSVNYISGYKSDKSKTRRYGYEVANYSSLYIAHPFGYPEWGSQVNFSCYAVSDQPDLTSLHVSHGWFGGHDAYPVKRGGIATLEYSFPILKIRQGLWNPNIYLGDLAFVPYVDSVFGQEIHPHYRGGAEIRPDYGLAFGVYSFLMPVAGVNIDRGSKPNFYLGLSFISGNAINAKKQLPISRYYSKY